MSNAGKRWIDDLTDIFSSAARTNSEVMKRGVENLKDTLVSPAEISRIIFESSPVIARGYADYIRLNIEHSQRLVELGRKLSDDILAAFDRPRASMANQTREPSTPFQSVGEISMAGAPGDLCRSVFVLESNRTETVTARVGSSRFVNIENNLAASIPMIVEPEEAVVKPGDRIRFTTETGIPEDTPQGTYRAMVWVDGFPELSLRVTLSVCDTTDNRHRARESRKPKKEPTKRRREKS